MQEAKVTVDLREPGVQKSRLNSIQDKIRCACLGTVFNLPMSTVTLVEDGLMIAMAAAALLGIGH